jgi:hypothetical protein
MRTSQSLPRLGVGWEGPGPEDRFSDFSHALRHTNSASALEVQQEAARAHAARFKPPKPLRGPALAIAHQRLVAASYASGGQDWAALFRQVDRDGSGTIEPLELLYAVRAALKLPPSEVHLRAHTRRRVRPSVVVAHRERRSPTRDRATVRTRAWERAPDPRRCSACLAATPPPSSRRRVTTTRAVAASLRALPPPLFRARDDE